MLDPFSDALIDRIYDAAIEPQIWGDVLVSIADGLNSTGGAAFAMLADGTGSAFCHYGRYEPPRDHRESGRHMINPWTKAVFMQPSGRILASHKILPLEKLRRTDFYEDILKPEKLDHCVITSVYRNKDVNFAFNIMRSDRKGPYAPDEIAWLNQIMPHLRNSARVRLIVEGLQALSHQQQSVLDHVGTGFFLCDELGRYSCGNKAANEILGQPFGLKLKEGKLSARGHNDTQKLHELVHQTSLGGAGGMMTIQRHGLTDPLLIIVFPIRGNLQEMLWSPGRKRNTVALFVKDPLRDYDGSDDALSLTFELTKAEVRVALAMLKLSSENHPDEKTKINQLVAGHLDLSINTVKTHLKNIYVKMHVKNHTQLVLKLSKIASF
jgi:DNA-binding CsgD family transcriptional regulator